MKIKSILSVAVLLLASVSAQAGVIYEWKPVKKQSPSHFVMKLEFDDATVKNGFFSLHIDGETDNTETRPDSGLLGFYLPYTNYQPRTELFNHGMDFGFLHMDVQFVEGKFLSGSIRYFDFQTQLNMASDLQGNPGPLFEISEANADYEMGDCAGPTGIICSGGTGYLRQVPEPGTVGLLGLGLLAAYTVRRRKRVH